MADELLTSRKAAQRLGIAVATLYEWLGQSDHGGFMIRGQSVTINYLQSGAKGQGRIRIEEGEIARIRELMRVRPQLHRPRKKSTSNQNFPGITARLGRPDEV
ncbi:DNA-binding protein [Lignipirellula cremea]|uniref:DNA-binding protein n=1 Tax=Lignipirellula cremea TaxID=2528010 RepID=UPI0011AAFE65|nr:DNA-binding protein [Lignipirellula cremea]